ncbi:MAG: hypothetical protein R3F14_23650 [Polyangiaceae bacterium]
MSEKTEAKAQNPFIKMAETQLTQMNAMFDEMAKMQASSMEQVKSAVDESARLSKETLGYWANLAGESRRLTVDAMKRGMGFFQAGV